MYILVEMCAANIEKGSRPVFEKLEQDPRVDVIDYGCLSECGLCSNTWYAFVEGEKVAAQSPERLYDKIISKIDSIDQ